MSSRTPRTDGGTFTQHGHGAWCLLPTRPMRTITIRRRIRPIEYDYVQRYACITVHQETETVGSLPDWCRVYDAEQRRTSIWLNVFHSQHNG